MVQHRAVPKEWRDFAVKKKVPNGIQTPLLYDILLNRTKADVQSDLNARTD